MPYRLATPQLISIINLFLCLIIVLIKIMNRIAIGEFATTALLKYHFDNVIKVIVKSNKEKEKYNKFNIDIEVNEKEINKIVKKEDIYSIAYFNEYKSSLNKNAVHVLIHDLNDEGEIGAIIRTMVAFNFFDLVLINSNVDIFSNKVIRASTGAIFMINVERFKDLNIYKKKYKNKYIEFFNKDNLCSLDIANKLYKLQR